MQICKNVWCVFVGRQDSSCVPFGAAVLRPSCMKINERGGGNNTSCWAVLTAAIFLKVSASCIYQQLHRSDPSVQGLLLLLYQCCKAGLV